MAILDSDAKERRLNLRIESNKEGFIGFNIRGGLEYGLGIYVSRYECLKLLFESIFDGVF